MGNKITKLRNKEEPDMTKDYFKKLIDSDEDNIKTLIHHLANLEMVKNVDYILLRIFTNKDIDKKKYDMKKIFNKKKYDCQLDIEKTKKDSRVEIYLGLSQNIPEINNIDGRILEKLLSEYISRNDNINKTLIDIYEYCNNNNLKLSGGAGYKNELCLCIDASLDKLLELCK